MGNLDKADKTIRVLVVDDYALTRNMVESIIKQAGFRNIDYADSGSQAIDKLHDRDFGLVICDWNMPHGSGLEVLKFVRSKEHYRTLPFLMLTAEAYRKNVQEAIKAGVSDYIVKPFTPQILLDKMSQILTE